MRWYVPVIALLVGCGGGGGEGESAPNEEAANSPSAAAYEPKSASQPPAHTEAETAPATNVELTFYWVAVRPADDPDEVRLMDCDGGLLTDASNEFRAAVHLEGTGRARLDSGETVTFRRDGGCYRRIDEKKFPWGIGSTGEAVRPFRSIAVDKNRFTLGKWYYAKELDGRALPSPGSGNHDGCVRAVDEGPAIRGNHVDLFIGDKRAYPAMAELTRLTLQESERCASR